MTSVFDHAVKELIVTVTKCSSPPFQYNQHLPNMDLSHVNEKIDVVIVPLHVLVLYQPLYLLLDQFLTWQKHVLQYIYQLSLNQDKIRFTLISLANRTWS